MWSLAVFWPVIAFATSQMIPMFRLRPVLASVWIAAIAVAFWIGTAVAVIDVG